MYSVCINTILYMYSMSCIHVVPDCRGLSSMHAHVHVLNVDWLSWCVWTAITTCRSIPSPMSPAVPLGSGLSYTGTEQLIHNSASHQTAHEERGRGDDMCELLHDGATPSLPVGVYRCPPAPLLYLPLLLGPARSPLKEPAADVKRRTQSSSSSSSAVHNSTSLDGSVTQSRTTFSVGSREEEEEEEEEEGRRGGVASPAPHTPREVLTFESSSQASSDGVLGAQLPPATLQPTSTAPSGPGDQDHSSPVQTKGESSGGPQGQAQLSECGLQQRKIEHTPPVVSTGGKISPNLPSPSQSRDDHTRQTLVHDKDAHSAVSPSNTSSSLQPGHLAALPSVAVTSSPSPMDISPAVDTPSLSPAPLTPPNSPPLPVTPPISPPPLLQEGGHSAESAMTAVRESRHQGWERLPSGRPVEVEVTWAPSPSCFMVCEL